MHKSLALFCRSPDRSRLIRLDDAPIILGRRTRSGKEFADPPIRKRPPPTKTKPKTDPLPPRKENRRPRPSKKSRWTGQRSKQQTGLQEAQKRSANGSDLDADSRRDEDNATDDDQTADDDDLPLAFLFAPSMPTRSSVPANSRDIASSMKAGPAPASPDPILLPNRSISSTAPTSSAAAVPALSILASPSVLKFTHSDAVIAPTGVRRKEATSKDMSKPEDLCKRPLWAAKPTSSGDVSTAVQPASKDDMFTGPENFLRLGTKDIWCKSKDSAPGPKSKSVLGIANNVPTLTGGSKSSAKSFLDGATKKFVLAGGSLESKGAPLLETQENPPSLPKTTSGKASPIKDGVKLNSDAKNSRTGILDKPPTPATITRAPAASSNASNAATTTGSLAASSRTIKPFSISISSHRSGSKPDGSSKSSSTIPFVALGKRKEPSSSLPSLNRQSLSQVQPQKHEFVLSLCHESETHEFIVNSFRRKAKMMELTRKGLSEDTFQVEMEKWMDMERAEWREQEWEKAKEEGMGASGGRSDARYDPRSK